MQNNTLNSSDNRSLEALEKRRALVGNLGVLDFLIERARALRERQAAASSEAAKLVGIADATQVKNQCATPAKSRANQIKNLRTKLLGLGFTEEPLAELEEIARHDPDAKGRSDAACELALWYMRAGTEDGDRIALSWLAQAKHNTSGSKQLVRAGALEMMCHHKAADTAAARRVYESLESTGLVTPNIRLAWANFQPSPEARVAVINQALADHGIPAASLNEDVHLPAYDRLRMAEPVIPVRDGPKVTVLLAAYDAAVTLPTALRSLQEQSWKNLEIIVLDDCSPTPNTLEVAGRFAATDARIRVERMPINGGAYVARNRGLDLATGEFVTIHDADDWSHPLKIETQVRFMLEHPMVMGCLTQQARCQGDLTFKRISSDGTFIIVNTSSFMFRRVPVTQGLGYWDTVRFSADNEFIRRIQRVFGGDAIRFLETGPYSFQRDSDTSIVADEFFGLANGGMYGIRRQYWEAQTHHHQYPDRLRYGKDPSHRAFPVPQAMQLSPAQARQTRHYDVVLGSDFRMIGGSTQSNVQEIVAQKRAGIRTAILPMYRYDLPFSKNLPMLPEVWEQVDGDWVNVLAYGQKVTCDLLILRYPPVLQHLLRYMPQVEAKEIRVIVNQTPMSDYGPDGVVRYTFQQCAENIRRYFGKDAIWHPIGPLVREALREHHSAELHHIQLADEDWANIIDVDEWSRGERQRSSQDKLRIGRHSRDHELKWPADRDELLLLYPAVDDVEVHVLGGGKTPARVLGEGGTLPPNWVVHEFGALHPKDFLAGIDVFIYFANPGWVESFGRTILEAMAVGVPVILPDFYRSLFKDAALYATPQTAGALARQLHADAAAYASQTRRAQDFVRAKFGFGLHLNRLGILGVQGGR